MALAGFTFRRLLTIDQTQIDSTLTDFPVLVKLTDSFFDFSNCNPDFSDIRFTEDDGDTLLDYEIDSIVQLSATYGSNVFTGGTAGGSVAGGGHPTSDAFDGNDSTFWATDPGTLPYSISYDLGSGQSKTVEQIRLKPFRNGGGAYVKNFTIYGSNLTSPDPDTDGDWTSIYSGQHADTDSYENFEFANATAYRHYRIKVTSNWRAFQDAGIYTLEGMEQTDPGGDISEAYFWVKQPSVSSSVDTDFYLYYGNVGATDASSPNDVWDSDHKGVWHLSESGNGTTDEFKDSTVNSNDGTASGTVTQSGDIIGYSQSFSNSKVRIADVSALELGSSDAVISFKVKFNSVSGSQCMLGRDTDGSSYFYFAIEGGSVIRFRDYNSGNIIDFTSASNPFSAGVLHDVEYVRSGSTHTIYVDNVSVATTSSGATFLDRAEGWDFGGQSTISYMVDGKMDEVRFTIGSPRSADWRKARIAGDNDDLLNYGSEAELVDVDEDETVIVSDSITVEDTMVDDSETIVISDSIIVSDTLAGGSETIVISDSIIVTNVGGNTDASFGTRILSINPLIFVTDTNPAEIVKVDTTDPENLIWEVQAITGITNVLDASINFVTEFIYVAGADGKVCKIEIDNISNQEIINLSDTDDLTNIESSDTLGLTLAATENTVGELYLIDERETVLGELRIDVLAQYGLPMDTDVHIIHATSMESNIEVLAEHTAIMTCSIIVLTNELDAITPIKRNEWQVFVDSVELEDFDVDLSSIDVNLVISEQSSATMRLNRKHDKIDYDLANNLRQITAQNNIEIRVQGNTVFTGKIAEVDCQYNEQEFINITAFGVEAVHSFANKNLSLPSLDAKLGLYDILIQNPRISNPYIDPSDENPKKYKGIKVSLGDQVKQSVKRFQTFDSSGSIATKIQDGTFNPKQNWEYFWGSITVIKPQFFGKTNSILGENPFQFPSVQATGQTSGYVFFYIGTSLSPVTEDLWVLKNANYRYQRQYDDIVTPLGDYTVGVAPFKEISVKNGIFIPDWKWEDRDDGLYSVLDEAHNHTEFAKRVANLEYQLLQNINGQILPDTSCSIQMTLDAYFFHGIQLLNRINVDNTTQAGIYKNANGFPVSVKSININSGSMKLSIQADNTLSEVEQEAIRGQFPDEDSPEFNNEEDINFIVAKTDMRTKLQVQ